MYRPSDDPTRRSLRRNVSPSDAAKARAKQLRRELSPPERLLWSRLRRSHLGGLRFRKQHPVGPYIADFYCHEIDLVVEIDGWMHTHARDEARDCWMAARNTAVLRVPAADVFRDLTGVLELIHRVAQSRLTELGRMAPPPAPPGEVSHESASVTEGA